MFRLEKFSAFLKLLYLGNVSRLFENEVQELTHSTYNQVKPRVMYAPKRDLRLELNNPISHPEKIVLFTNFIPFAKKGYIGQASRHLKTRLNEHIPKCILKFIKEKTNNKTKAVVNDTKRSLIT